MCELCRGLGCDCLNVALRYSKSSQRPCDIVFKLEIKHDGHEVYPRLRIGCPEIKANLIIPLESCLEDEEIANFD